MLALHHIPELFSMLMQLVRLPLFNGYVAAVLYVACAVTLAIWVSIKLER